MISFAPHDVFLVTGASSGLGAASALLLNRLGAQVIAVGRNQERLSEVRQQSAFPEAFHCEQKDLVEDIASLKEWMKGLRAQYGKLRGCLHAAGVCAVVPVQLQTIEAMQDLYQVNVFSAYQLARAFLDRRHNTGQGASFVFLASTGALHDNAGISSYASSKGAIIALMRSLACEFREQQIRVNSISPALVPTSMTRAIYDDLDARAAAYPLGPGTPEDVAHAAAFLLSAAARWVTGQNLIVDGGIGLQ